MIMDCFIRMQSRNLKIKRDNLKLSLRAECLKRSTKEFKQKILS